MKRTAGVLILIVALGACVTFSRYYKDGNAELLNQNWEAAIESYQRAIQEDPNNSVYRLALMRAKISASRYFLILGRRLANQGEKEPALEALEKALTFDSGNGLAKDEISRLLEEPAEAKEVEKVRFEPPVKLKVATEKIVLNFPQEVSLRSIFVNLGKYAGINFIFDRSFRESPFSIDMTNLDFEQAVNNLCMATGNFYRIVDETTVLIAQDQPQNRMKYDLQGIKTFYLSNIDAQEIATFVLQHLRTAGKVPTVTLDKNNNAITVKDTPQNLEIVAELIRMWDRIKGEVVLDLELMEVSRQKVLGLGIRYDQLSGGVSYNPTNSFAETGWAAVSEIAKPNKHTLALTFPSAAVLDFLETDTDTKLISQPRLRGIHGEKMEYIVGDEVPVPNTVFQAFAAGGVNTQPITNYEYKKVGIDLVVTPQIHSEGEVTLELDLKIKALGGSGFQDLPIISTREIRNTIRLRDGETNLLAGLLKDEERKTMKGIPGIQHIPILGSLFGSTDQEIRQTDVILTITPHIIRRADIDDSSESPIWVPLSDSPVSGVVAADQFEENMYRDRAPIPARIDRMGEGSWIRLNPPLYEAPRTRGDFRINVNLNTSDPIQNMSVTFNYDGTVIQLTRIDRGNVIQSLGAKAAFMENIDNAGGTCTIGFTGEQMNKGFTGGGRIVTLIFKPIAAGESPITITTFNAMSTQGRSVQLETSDARILIR